MIAHPIPVLWIVADLTHIQPVCSSFHILRCSSLPGNGADIIAEQHGVDTKNLVAHGIRFPIELNLRIHDAVILLFCRIAFVKTEDRLIKLSVNQRVCHSNLLPYFVGFIVYMTSAVKPALITAIIVIVKSC